jgi:prepilin-type N-terminal cleavage/methylation domain-containing protein
VKLQTVNLNDRGLTLVEVLIASLITLILFMALMQTALLSIDVNAGNALRNEVVSIAEERMREIRDIGSSDDFNALSSDPTDPDLDGADCPAEFVTDFGTDGRLIQRPFRNVDEFDFCTNLTCVELGGDSDCATFDAGVDIRQINITVGWIWLEEDYMHRISTIMRRP